jgi:hypothetical protein
MIGITIEHEQIINWTQSRGGRPAVGGSLGEASQPAISFTSEEGGTSWEEWLSVFDNGEWAFIYEDRKGNGELSRVWKTIPRFAA